MASTTAKGYGWQHQKLRAALLRALVPGSPCPRCNQPMWPGIQALDLGHEDGSGKTRYVGLEHATCNRVAGAKFGTGSEAATAPSPASASADGDDGHHPNRHHHDPASGKRRRFLETGQSSLPPRRQRFSLHGE
jgi:hypothetical protein